jgi:hypothetical protein
VVLPKRPAIELTHRPPSEPTLLKLLSFASGDGISGVTDRDSTPGLLLGLVADVDSFFLRLSEALDAVLALRATPTRGPSST